MEIEFGFLREEDLEECCKLCAGCFGEDIDISEVRETYMKCRDDPHYRFIAGRYGGRIAAYATMVMFHNLFDGKRPVAVLWYVCVDESLRRQGLGRKLFGEIERIAAENDCELIYFTCLEENHGAQEFYRSLGYRDDKERSFVKYFFDEKKDCP